MTRPGRVHAQTHARKQRPTYHFSRPQGGFFMPPLSIHKPLPEVDQARLKPALRERPRLTPRTAKQLEQDAVDRALDIVERQTAP